MLGKIFSFIFGVALSAGLFLAVGTLRAEVTTPCDCACQCQNQVNTNQSVPPPPICQNLDLRLNELVSDPVSGGSEWIEFFNIGNGTIDLKDWTVEDGSGRKTSLSGSLGAKGLSTVTKPSGALNNSGDIVILKCADTVVDTVTYGDWDDGNTSDNAVAAVDPYSLARVQDGVDTGSDIDDWRVTQTPTKGSFNSITALASEDEPASIPTEESMLSQPSDTASETSAAPEPIDYSNSIIINEVLPNPVGADTTEEFIELKNISTAGIDLAGWQVADAAKPYTIAAGDFATTNVAAGGLFLIRREVSGIALNNSGTEEVFLFSPDGAEQDHLTYSGTVAEGSSYSRTADGFVWTPDATPGQENIVFDVTTENTGEDAVPVENAADGLVIATVDTISTVPSGESVRVRGTVAVEPGVLGTQIMYLQNPNIQIYFYKKDWPALALGDFVQVTGEMSESKGEPRIKISATEDIVVLSHGQSLSAQTVEELGEGLEGSLVTVSGQFTERKSNTLWLDTGQAEVVVYLKTSTGIKAPGFLPGTRIQVTGIVSQNDDTYQLLPRDQEDFVLLENETKVLGVSTEKPAAHTQYAYGWFLIIGGLGAAGWFMYRRMGSSADHSA
ncbi:lamin tail domain-containing protein [Candidatus Falkowbacteria bacterium]|nr:lamin tail domain-containing protein [Candidatus Falkowbacteria bacterium]